MKASFKSIDINCDLGEGNDLKHCDADKLFMKEISRCNIACGGHAGNPITIRESIKNAKHFGLKVGLHPSYTDKANFGRQPVSLSIERICQDISIQLELGLKIAASEGVDIQHIKLHGALYNDVETNMKLASGIAELLCQFNSNLEILGLAQGMFEEVCVARGLKFIPEGFMDRRYMSNGKLSSRIKKGSVIKQIEVVVEQAVALATRVKINTMDGKFITPEVQTICLHGDNPNAHLIATSLKRKLMNIGYLIQ